MHVEWEKRLLQADYSMTKSKSGERLMETAEVAQPAGAPRSPVESVSGDWQLTQRDGDGLEGRAERVCQEELNWVPTKS